MISKTSLSKSVYVLSLIGLIFIGRNQTIAQSNLNIKTDLIQLNTPFTDQVYAWHKNDFLNYSPGISISYEFFLIERKWSNRITTSFLLPSSSYPVLSLGNSLHVSIYNKWRTAINLSAGIGIIHQPESFEKNKTSLHPIAAIELNRSIMEKTDISVSIGSQYPNTISINVGLRFWISKEIKKKKGCLACPN